MSTIAGRKFKAVPHYGRAVTLENQRKGWHILTDYKRTVPYGEKEMLARAVGAVPSFEADLSTKPVEHIYDEIIKKSDVYTIIMDEIKNLHNHKALFSDSRPKGISESELKRLDLFIKKYEKAIRTFHLKVVVEDWARTADSVKILYNTIHPNENLASKQSDEGGTFASIQQGKLDILFDYLHEHCNMDRESVFLDCGGGLGAPAGHAAYKHCGLGISVEIDRERVLEGAQRYHWLFKNRGEWVRNHHIALVNADLLDLLPPRFVTHAFAFDICFGPNYYRFLEWLASMPHCRYVVLFKPATYSKWYDYVLNVLDAEEVKRIGGLSFAGAPNSATAIVFKRRLPHSHEYRGRGPLQDLSDLLQPFLGTYDETVEAYTSLVQKLSVTPSRRNVLPRTRKEPCRSREMIMCTGDCLDCEKTLMCLPSWILSADTSSGLSATVVIERSQFICEYSNGSNVKFSTSTKESNAELRHMTDWTGRRALWIVSRKWINAHDEVIVQESPLAAPACHTAQREGKRARIPIQTATPHQVPQSIAKRSARSKSSTSDTTVVSPDKTEATPQPELKCSQSVDGAVDDDADVLAYATNPWYRVQAPDSKAITPGGDAAGVLAYLTNRDGKHLTKALTGLMDSSLWERLLREPFRLHLTALLRYGAWKNLKPQNLVWVLDPARDVLGQVLYGNISIFEGFRSFTPKAIMEPWVLVDYVEHLNAWLRYRGDGSSILFMPPNVFDIHATAQPVPVVGRTSSQPIAIWLQQFETTFMFFEYRRKYALVVFQRDIQTLVVFDSKRCPIPVKYKMLLNSIWPSANIVNGAWPLRDSEDPADCGARVLVHADYIAGQIISKGRSRSDECFNNVDMLVNDVELQLCKMEILKSLSDCNRSYRGEDKRILFLGMRQCKEEYVYEKAGEPMPPCDARESLHVDVLHSAMRNGLSPQAARDLYRCIMSERTGWRKTRGTPTESNDVKVFTIDSGVADEGHWNDDRHVFGPFDTTSIQVLEDLKQKCNTLDEVVLDWFYTPDSWARDRWAEPFFTFFLPNLVKTGLLSRDACVYVPVKRYTLEMMSRHYKTLQEYYKIALMEASDAVSLYRGTLAIPDEIIVTFGRDPSQLAQYSTETIATGEYPPFSNPLIRSANFFRLRKRD